MGMRLSLPACALILVALAASCGDDGGGSSDTEVPIAIATTAVPETASCENAVPPVTTRVGERYSVRGAVTGTSIAEDARGRSFVLELGAEGGGVPFAVAIPESAAGNFGDEPRDLYDGREICVSGVVIDHHGVPTIFVTSPEEIVESEPVDP
jgi:hypothetical protein